MLLELPLEIVEHIILQLPFEDILNIGICCKKLNGLVNCESLWEKCAKRDYDLNLRCTKTENSVVIDENEERNDSAKMVYRYLLLPYGQGLHTIWQRSNYVYYGGLAKLLYHNYILYLVEFEPPAYPSTHHPLQQQIICKIYLKPQSNAVIIINTLENRPSDKEEGTAAESEDTLDVYKATKQNDENLYHMCLKSKAAETSEWLRLRDEGGYDQEGYEPEEIKLSERLGIPLGMAKLRFKHQLFYRKSGVQHFRSMCNSSYDPKRCPIKPGCFNATYGSHGIEIIQLRYDNDKNEIVGLKITGDPNVPFGEISFKGYLNKPIKPPPMSDDDEDSAMNYFEKLQNSFNISMDSEDCHSLDLNPPTQQPFELPASFSLHTSLNDFLTLNDLKEYLWRYASRIQIAGGGFQNPSFVDAHLIIFSEDTIALINIEIRSLKICHRVKENLSAINYEDVFAIE